MGEGEIKKAYEDETKGIVRARASNRASAHALTSSSYQTHALTITLAFAISITRILALALTF